MNRFLMKIVCVLGLLGSVVCAADFKLDRVFANHMVLQRNQPVPVSGTAEAGAKVTVEFAGQKKNAVTDSSNHWKIILDPLPASSKPRNLQVSTFELQVSITNVLIGDVWICSGQSNMELPIRACNDAEKEIAAAKYPDIRLLSIPRRVDVNLREQIPNETSWQRCSPQSVAEFSAAGYFFGRDLQRELKVPIGLVKAAWGGTKIQNWTPLKSQQEQTWSAPLLDPWKQLEVKYPDLHENFDHYGQVYVKAFLRIRQEKWQWTVRRKEAKAAGRTFDEPPPVGIAAPYPGHRDTPGGLYGGMIHALTRIPVRGVIWYQGESDAGSPGLYVQQFALMIQEWRCAWKSPELPFYFVQLASWKKKQGLPVEENGWSTIREAQRQVSKTVPYTGMAVSIDIGDANDVHPRNKQEVGRRLALLALNRTYGISCVDSGPELIGMKREGQRIRLLFKHAEGGLVFDGKQPDGFAIREKGTGWYWGKKIEIDGSSLLVWNDYVKKPCSVRYAWAYNPKGFLRNRAGLPASPFRVGEEIPDFRKTKSQSYTPAHDLKAAAGVVAVDTNLPNILLIGDSISIAYTPFVRGILKGKANVFRPHDRKKNQSINCGSTDVGLKGLDDWLNGRPWDVIHFNWGLHDLCYRNPKVTHLYGNRDKVGGTLSVPLDRYKKNLEQLVQKLEATGATLVWASTTRVPSGEAGRIVGDDVRYNQAAADLMARHGIRIDDLYALTQAFPEKDALAAGDVHFKESGSRKIAAQVANEILQAVDPGE